MKRLVTTGLLCVALVACRGKESPQPAHPGTGVPATADDTGTAPATLGDTAEAPTAGADAAPTPPADQDATPTAANGDAAPATGDTQAGNDVTAAADVTPMAAPALASELPNASVAGVLESRSGSQVQGNVVMAETPEGVTVLLKVTGAPPGAKAVHVHEKGDCSADDGSSAGDHFNPGGHQHGLPTGEGQRHLGDFGNMVVAEDGTGTLTITAPGANLRAGDTNSFLGRAVIVHGNPDTGEQPAGNAGPRIACAVLRPIEGAGGAGADAGTAPTAPDAGTAPAATPDAQ